MRRYLRLYTFDFDGEVMKRKPRLSNALMPATRLHGMRLPAYLIASGTVGVRRSAAVEVLVHARKRRHSHVYGVAFVCCPSRRLSASVQRASGRPVALTATNSYQASFAALGPSNTIWAGDAMRETLMDMVEHLTTCVRHVRVEEDHRPGMFTPALA
jgi:hypothetical protein